MKNQSLTNKNLFKNVRLLSEQNQDKSAIIDENDAWINWVVVEKMFAIDRKQWLTWAKENQMRVVDKTNQSITLDFNLSDFKAYQDQDYDDQNLINQYLPLVHSLATVMNYYSNSNYEDLNQRFLALMKKNLYYIQDPLQFYYQVYQPYFLNLYQSFLNTNPFYQKHHQLSWIYLRPSADPHHLSELINHYLVPLARADEKLVKQLLKIDKKELIYQLNDHYNINIDHRATQQADWNLFLKNTIKSAPAKKYTNRLW